MSYELNNAIESTVKTLLHVGERVVEVSREQVMTRIWDREGSPLTAYRDHYLGKRIAEIRNDSTIVRCREGIEQAFENGTDSYVEYISYANDNNGIIAYSLRVLACHPDKNFVFLVIDNISKGREDILVEDKWKLALDASDQGVWDANMEEKTIFFSEKWERLFGYSAKEITRVAEWSEKIYPEDIVAAEEKVQEYLAGKTPIYSAELRYRCKDGSYKWILSRGVVISYKADGSPLRFIGTHADITIHKQAEEELREAKEIFANSFNYSGAGKALLAPGGKWLEVNDVICSLTGYSREELLGLHYRDITYPDDIDIDVPLIQQLLKKEITSYSIEKRYVAKNRKVLTTMITVSLVWGKDDTPRYFVCDIVDMTNMKETGEELKRRNQELETTSASLISKMNQLEDLNHIIAHNLRGPAGNIKILSDDTGIFPVQDAIKMIHTSSLTLLSSLDMLVEAARIKLDKKIVAEICDVQKIIDSIAGQLQGTIYQNHVQLETELAPSEITYPKVYLESILYNLISNAIKYRRYDIQPVIKIATTMHNERVQLSVKDNGLGIDMEQYGNKLFKLNQVFHPGHDSKGVGLFITKTQIEAMGGSIDVYSKPNEGCTFIVVL